MAEHPVSLIGGPRSGTVEYVDDPWPREGYVHIDDSLPGNGTAKYKLEAIGIGGLTVWEGTYIEPGQHATEDETSTEGEPGPTGHAGGARPRRTGWRARRRRPLLHLSGRVEPDDDVPQRRQRAVRGRGVGDARDRRRDGADALRSVDADVASRAPRGRRARRGQRGQRGRQARRGRRATRARPERRARRGHRASRVSRARRAIRACRDRRCRRARESRSRRARWRRRRASRGSSPCLRAIA